MRRYAQGLGWFALSVGGVGLLLHVARLAAALTPVQCGLLIFAGLLVAGTAEKWS